MKVLALICAAVLLLTAFSFFSLRSIIFPAPAGKIPVSLPEDVEHIPLNQGHALLALPIHSRGAAPLLVFAHGNAELAQWSLDSFELLRRRGFAVLLLEYPGYGGTAGSPSSRSITAAALQAVDKVLGRAEIDANRLVAYGRSIGTGVACAIALQRKAAALVLESPFESLAALAAEKGLPGFLLRDSFDNAAAVAAVDIPLFLYHGSRDQIIPIHHSQRLAELSAQAVLHSAACGHNDCPRPWPQLLAFFAAHGIIQAGEEASHRHTWD